MFQEFLLKMLLEQNLLPLQLAHICIMLSFVFLLNIHRLFHKAIFLKGQENAICVDNEN
jgi:hypothetical protein